MTAKKSKPSRADRRDAQRRRERHRDVGEGPTLGELVEAADLLPKTSTAVRRVITRAVDVIRDSARVQLSVVACDNCSAPKACCTLRTNAWLFEGVPIAHRLRREGRDTPALREALRTSAQLMETRSADEYRRPCVFLSPEERCTIYDDRPTVCGTTMVSNDPFDCSKPGGKVQKYLHPFAEAAATAQALFEQEAGLPPVAGSYLRPLPRVVLLCLEAWDRRDFVGYITGRLAATARSAAPPA